MPQEVEKPKTQPMRVGFSAPPKVDMSPQHVTIMDSNNVVLSPDGSEARNIDGSIATNAYRVTTTPVGYKAIVRETNPPDVDQRMYMIINTAGSQNRVEQIEFGRNLGKEEQVVEAQVGGPLPLEFNVSASSVYVNIAASRISGSLDIPISGRTIPYGGTAVAGVDYNAAGGSFTIPAGATEVFFDAAEILSVNFGRYFYIRWVSDSPNVTVYGPQSLNGPLTLVP